MSTSKSSYERLLSVSQIQAYEKITAICEPLRDLFNIHAFTYSHLTKDGDCLHIGSRPDILEDYFYSDQILTSPTLSRCHYTMTPAIKIWEPENESEDELASLCEYFKKNKLISGITLTTHKESGRETYYFGTHQRPEKGADYWYHILPSLYEFIRFFSMESKSILNKFKDHQVALPELIGKPFYEASEQASKNSVFIERDARQLLQKHWLTSRGLTQREISIMQECLLGKTSKQISEKLSISSRTVENNIQNIKEKFGCASQKELMLYFLDKAA